MYGARTPFLAAATWAALIVVIGVMPIQRFVGAVASGRETAATLVGHFLAYCILAILLVAALGGRRSASRRAALVMALAVSLGVVVEAVQALLPYRDCQLVDVLFNAAGAACGLVVLSAVVRRRTW